MSILYKNARNVRFVLFRKNSIDLSDFPEFVEFTQFLFRQNANTSTDLIAYGLTSVVEAKNISIREFFWVAPWHN